MRECYSRGAPKVKQGYSIRYAITKGIERVQVRVTGRYAHAEEVVGGVKIYAEQLEVGVDLFFQREEAVEAAKQKARARVRSLERSLAKARALAEEPKWSKE